MRDDIHKDAPVPKNWKQVIRICVQRADWRTAAPPKLSTVILAELRKEIGADLIRVLPQLLLQPELRFNTTDPHAELPSLGRQLSDMEGRYLAEVRRHVEQGASVAAAIEHGVGTCIKTNLSRYLRAIDGYVLTSDQRSHNELMPRLSEVWKAPAVDVIARTFLRILPSGSAPSTASQPSIDDDIRSL